MTITGNSVFNFGGSKVMKGKAKMATKADLKKMADKDRKEDKKMMSNKIKPKGTVRAKTY